MANTGTSDININKSYKGVLRAVALDSEGKVNELTYQTGVEDILSMYNEPTIAISDSMGYVLPFVVKLNKETTTDESGESHENTTTTIVLGDENTNINFAGDITVNSSFNLASQGLTIYGELDVEDSLTVEGDTKVDGLIVQKAVEGHNAFGASIVTDGSLKAADELIIGKDAKIGGKVTIGSKDNL